MSKMDEVPTDDGGHVRELQWPELRALGLLEAAAVAFGELPDLTPEDLIWGERHLDEARRRILARPAMEAYASRLKPCVERRLPHIH